MSRPYAPQEEAVLAEYVQRRVRSWNDVLARLDRRSRKAAEYKLTRMRRERGTLWRV